MNASELNPVVLAHNAISMARAMRNLGRTSRAVAKYDEAIAALPEFIEALDECLAVLESAEDWQGVADRCASWVALFPDHATHAEADRIHSRRLDALCRLGGIDAALDAYGLEPVARTGIAVDPEEILAVIGLRDELARLPHVLAHHRRLGVDRFLVIDNGSTDGSLEYLIDQPDTVVWRTDGSYRSANCGAVWWDLLLRRHAMGNWCLIIDADEYFVYPGWETRPLQDLCLALDSQQATCYPAVFLDMYGPGRLSESVIEPDTDLLESFPYFDLNWYRVRRGMAGPRRNQLNHWGGVRARIFGDRALDSYLLDKVPLFRHRQGEVLLSGNHWTDRPSAEISDGRGVLLHFKYDAGFAALINREVERGEHAGGARAYRRIADELQLDADPQLFDPIYSVRHESSEQLLEFGIMRPETAGTTASDTVALVMIPEIPEIPSPADGIDDETPLWSVVMIADSSDMHPRLERILRSLDGAPPSEIVIIVTGDAPDASSTVPDPGVHRIRMEITRLHLTELEAINHGLRVAAGRWVRVAGGEIEDATGLEAAVAGPDAASPMLQLVGDADVDVVVIGETVSAPLDLPLDLPVWSVGVRRDRVARFGGFATTLEGAAGWEFVQRVVGGDRRRLAVTTPTTPRTAATPAPPVSLQFGVDIAHRLTAIRLVAGRHELEASAVQRLLDRCADDAAGRIVADIERGSVGSAFSVFTEILNAPISTDSRDALVAAVSRRLR